MNQDAEAPLSTPQLFNSVIRAAGDTFSEDQVATIHQLLASSEPIVAFEIMLGNLYDEQVELGQHATAHLRQLAEWFGQLENPEGKGTYW